MAGQDQSPTEPSKAHPRGPGRGGVGNIQEARKWNVVTADEPPLRFDPVVRLTLSFELTFVIGP